MYIPPPFAEENRAKLFDLIEQESFAVVFSTVDGEPTATHVPLLLERETGELGTLVGHVAKANPMWRFLAGQTALAVFSGPHAYISPTWYAAENVVPTWNYVAVHASGRPELITDPVALEALVRRMVEHYERLQPQPWQLATGSTFVARLAEQIVGFRLPIAQLEGKWKLNQNHSAQRREQVIRALASQPGEDAAAIADLMQQTLPPRDEAVQA